MFRWTNEVFVAAKQVYEQSHPHSEAAFRIYLNVKLVPIKLSAGLTEESTEEAIGDEIAEKEYQLALVYLERVLNAFVSLEEVGDHTFTPFLKKGFEIKQILKELLGRVRRRKQHAQNGFV